MKVLITPLLRLQSQVFPIQQPVQQQRTEEPTYEVEDGPCTTHSGQRHRLPTSRLTEGKAASSFLLLFFLPLGPVLFVIPPPSHPSSPPPHSRYLLGLSIPTPTPLPSSPTHPGDGKSWVSVLGVSGAMHARLASQHSALPPTLPTPPTPRTHEPPLFPFTLTACRIDRPTDRPTGHSSETCFPFCTYSWEIWPRPPLCLWAKAAGPQRNGRVSA